MIKIMNQHYQCRDPKCNGTKTIHGDGVGIVQCPRCLKPMHLTVTNYEVPTQIPSPEPKV